MLVNPFLKMTYTFRAPHRRADVQQSKAVSPHPRTITFPNRSGNLVLQEQVMPTTKWIFRTINDSSNKGTVNTYNKQGVYMYKQAKGILVPLSILFIQLFILHSVH